MKAKILHHLFAASLLLSVLCLSSCRTGSAPANPEAEGNTGLAPQRVDIRGDIIMNRYDQGQIVLEIESLAISPDSRYTRAYVLVLPTTQIIGPDGNSMSMNELFLGQRVAVLLRGGGNGNFVGVGVARKMWVEDAH